MNAVKPIELLNNLFRRRRGIVNRLTLKQAALDNFDKRDEAKLWGDAAIERRAFLNNNVTQERQRLYEIEADIVEAAAWLVNERANRETMETKAA